MNIDAHSLRFTFEREREEGREGEREIKRGKERYHHDSMPWEATFYSFLKPSQRCVARSTSATNPFLLQTQVPSNHTFKHSHSGLYEAASVNICVGQGTFKKGLLRLYFLTSTAAYQEQRLHSWDYAQLPSELLISASIITHLCVAPPRNVLVYCFVYRYHFFSRLLHPAGFDRNATTVLKGAQQLARWEGNDRKVRFSREPHAALVVPEGTD